MAATVDLGAPKLQPANLASEQIILQHNPLYAPVALSGTAFEDLLASFQSQVPTFKASPPNPRQSFRWKSDVVVEPKFGVFRRNRYTADWSVTKRTNDERLSIILPIAGVADALVGTKVVTAPPLTALLAPTSMSHHIKLRCVGGEYASVTLMFDVEIVSRVLSAMFDGAKLSKLDLAPLLDLSTGAGATLNLLAQTIASGMLDARLFGRSPLAMPLLVEAALRLIFEHVPHRLSFRLNCDQLQVAPRYVRRAVDFMHDNLHQPLTMIDVAEAAGVSVRSLQAGFRKFKDTTPAAYLRRIRLEAVHAELSLWENRLPVSEVALKWGFTQMGRFAAQFHERFGRYPSEMLTRAR
jgi:AraC-like DNA-binding protein